MWEGGGKNSKATVNHSRFHLHKGILQLQGKSEPLVPNRYVFHSTAAGRHSDRIVRTEAENSSCCIVTIVAARLAPLECVGIQFSLLKFIFISPQHPGHFTGRFECWVSKSLASFEKDTPARIRLRLLSGTFSLKIHLDKTSTPSVYPKPAYQFCLKKQTNNCIHLINTWRQLCYMRLSSIKPFPHERQSQNKKHAKIQKKETSGMKYKIERYPLTEYKYQIYQYTLHCHLTGRV